MSNRAVRARRSTEASADLLRPDEGRPDDAARSSGRSSSTAWACTDPGATPLLVAFAAIQSGRPDDAARSSGRSSSTAWACTDPGATPLLVAFAAIQSGRPDSNRGPPAPKAGALPDCATPRKVRKLMRSRCAGVFGALSVIQQRRAGLRCGEPSCRRSLGTVPTPQDRLRNYLSLTTQSRGASSVLIASPRALSTRIAIGPCGPGWASRV